MAPELRDREEWFDLLDIKGETRYRIGLDREDGMTGVPRRIECNYLGI